MVEGRLPLWLFAIASLQEAGRSRLEEERRWARITLNTDTVLVGTVGTSVKSPALGPAGPGTVSWGGAPTTEVPFPLGTRGVITSVCFKLPG